MFVCGASVKEETFDILTDFSYLSLNMRRAYNMKVLKDSKICIGAAFCLLLLRNKENQFYALSKVPFACMLSQIMISIASA